MVKVANLVFNEFTNDSRVEKISKSLINNGYYVEVIAHLDRGLKDYEDIDGYKIRRFSYLDRKITKGIVGKSIAYVKYLFKSINYVKDFDILHCNDLNTMPIAYIIKTFFNKNIKVVYDAHEYETETIALRGLRKKVAKVAEKFLIKYANEVIAVSDAIANEYVRLYGIKKPYLILNAPKFTQISKHNLFRKNLNISDEKTIFLYQGRLSTGRGVEILLEAFEYINKNDIDKTSVIVFMGYGDLEDKIKDYANRYNNIFFHEAVKPDILLSYTSSADFGISTIEDRCLSYRYCLPNKMFEYIMAELLVIVSDLPEMKKLVQKYDIGVAAKSNTVEGLVSAIKEASTIDKDSKIENIKTAKDILNWEQQEKLLIELYQSLGVNNG